MTDPKKPLLEDPATGRLLYMVLALACVGLVIADFFIDRHPHFAVERMVGFFAVLGFAAYSFIVFAGHVVRKLLMREEDYYDR